MALTYHSHYFLRDLTYVSTAAVAPAYVDDAPAIHNFTTTETLIMLVIYNTCNYDLDPDQSGAQGTSVTLEVDGVDLDGIGVRHDQSQISDDRKNACTVYYLAELAPGDHTVQGRYARSWTPNAGRCCIHERQLAVFLFRSEDGDWAFTSSNVLQQHNVAAFQNDASASVALALAEDDMIVLALYSGSSRELDTEDRDGKTVAIRNVADAADRGWHGQTSSMFNSPNGCTAHVIYSTLGAGAHTFNGRFRANVDDQMASIHDRQLAVLVFSPDQLWDQVLDDVTLITTAAAHNVLQDDTPAVVNRNLPDTYQTLILYGSYNYHTDGGVGISRGKQCAINVDGTDYSEGHQCTNNSDYPKTGNTVIHAIELDVGPHTIQGRFAANVTANVQISRRTLSVLYFRQPEPVGPPICQCQFGCYTCFGNYRCY